jgi:hypothetical protein
VIYDTAWEDRLSELADYRNINGNCNVPTVQKTPSWLVGRPGSITGCPGRKEIANDSFRIPVIGSLGFDGTAITTWRDRLSGLPNIAKSTVTAMFLRATKKTQSLYRVGTQRKQYSCTWKGKKSMTSRPSRHWIAWVLNGSAQHRLGRPFE